MFRDGALVGDHLFAVDATHLWTFDLAKPSALARASLLTGLGTPLAVDRRQSELVLAAGASGLVMVDATNPALPVRSRSVALAGKAFDVQVSGEKAIVAMGAAGIAEVDLGDGVSDNRALVAGRGLQRRRRHARRLRVRRGVQHLQGRRPREREGRLAGVGPERDREGPPRRAREEGHARR